ncbi:MAG: hypothetical protein JNL30_15650 [Rubrivivax sp.]|nr:hypothetical protein [Rubrivivax sp.]
MRPWLNAATACLLLAAAPMSALALHVCTGADGKSSIQDKPCERPEAAPQHVPLKAQAVTPALALETAKRFTDAMQARDVNALRRLLARGFVSRITRPDGKVISLDAPRFGEYMSRGLAAAKAYRVTRTCKHEPAGDRAGVVALRCSYSDRMELFQRVATSQGEELMRLGLEYGEVKLVELSDAAAAAAEAGAGNKVVQR